MAFPCKEIISEEFKYCKRPFCWVHLTTIVHPPKYVETIPVERLLCVDCRQILHNIIFRVFLNKMPRFFVSVGIGSTDAHPPPHLSANSVKIATFPTSLFVFLLSV